MRPVVPAAPLALAPLLPALLPALLAALFTTACADPPPPEDTPAPALKSGDCEAQARGVLDRCGPAPGYYDAVDPRDPDTLRATLHARVDDHRRLPYNSRGTDTWVMLEAADAEPGRPGQIRDLYLHRLQAALGGGYGDYDREHAWPKSYGFPDDRAGNLPYTDGHALFLADAGYNRARGNRPFGWCTAADCEPRPTLGGEGTNYIDDGRGADGTWEVWPARRGDVARALFYLDVRYEGGRHASGAAEPDLILTDDRARIEASNTGENLAVAYMGLRSVLLEWHRLDPPDARERDRNALIERHQGNRNPFIDRPEWADCVFDGRCGAAPAGDPWISELHYDNAGADVGEFVEVAGPPGIALDGWRLVAYNGRDGRVYAEAALSGAMPASGALAVAMDGLQNGTEDGIALVDPIGDVIEFWSYEGTLVAADGPAAGRLSVDLGVAEGADTPPGMSLARDAADAIWRGPRPATPGRLD